MRTLDALNSLRKHIITTIAADNHIYIMGQSTIYQILRELKKRLAPTDYAREMEVVERYNRVKMFSKRENVEKWLKEWEVVYKTASELKIPDVDGKRVLFDFTHAISAIDSGFASTQEYFINLQISKSEPLPDIYRLIEDFRNHFRRTEALRLSASHSGFATFRNEHQDPEKNKKDSEHDRKSRARRESGQRGNGDSPRRERLCLCRDKHRKASRWEDCEYINPDKRPNGWKGNPENFERLNRSLNEWEQGKIDWFVRKFKYDGLKQERLTAPSPETPVRSRGGSQ